MAAGRLLYSYYGDDFTGSTDVLEGLASNGVETVLFLAPPSDAVRSRFAGAQAVGLAGDSRSRSPEWMSAHLPELFAGLHALGAPVLHYKVCSTFDSSPERGSIGRAIEVGRRVVGSDFTPVIVGAPHLGRYVAFGNLFAAAGNRVFRLDRHPTMSRHPATPMREADLRLHLGPQTELRIGAVELPALQGGRADAALQDQLAAGAEIVVFDGVDPATVGAAGEILWARAQAAPLFAAGSSGVTYSLLPQWRAAGLIAAAPEARPPVRVDRLLVVSGSCSPVTAGQIRRALAGGYAGISVDPERLTGQGGDELAAGYLEAALRELERRNVVIYTALGPLDAGGAAEGDALGQALGRMLRQLIERASLKRVLLCGGDTSSHAVAQLDLDALTWAGPLVPGAPLCRAHAATPPLDGLELVLKGGQIGPEGFFEMVRTGR
jgi:uncharacterized protein YgbK (DUF1537 family)